MGIDRDKRSLQALASPRYLALADPIVQWPRTPPFHGGNTGSNPVRVAMSFHHGLAERNADLGAELREKLFQELRAFLRGRASGCSLHRVGQGE